MGQLFSWGKQESEEPSEYSKDVTLINQKITNVPMSILNDIIKERIKLDERLIAENNAILKEFLETFIKRMKECDGIFSLLYKKNYYTGSYYSKLRIEAPDEYDINLVLNLPFGPDDIMVEYVSEMTAFVKYKLENASKSGASHPDLCRLFFENGYLMPSKVRFWFQSVVDKALLDYIPPKNVLLVEKSSSGPARTIRLVKANGEIDIDLVPVILCKSDIKPLGIDKRICNLFTEETECFLVPKDCPRSNYPNLWRFHLPDVEKKLMHDFGCAKPVIKLLKLLRNKEDWKILSSYYLQTVVMWMVVSSQNDKPNWKTAQLENRFVAALEALQKYVRENNLPYIFSSDYNLLQNMNYSHADIIEHRLENILKKIRRGSWGLWEIFGVKPTFANPRIVAA